jgi:nucleoside-diphosphate-sugar epimerase
VWVNEEVVPIPKNIYGVTKTAAENLCELFRRNHGLPCLILKTSRFFPEEDDDEQTRRSYEDANVKANEFLYRRVDLEKRGMNWRGGRATIFAASWTF